MNVNGYSLCAMSNATMQGECGGPGASPGQRYVSNLAYPPLNAVAHEFPKHLISGFWNKDDIEILADHVFFLENGSIVDRR